MDRITRLIQKAKQIQKNGPDVKYIAWATVCPRGDEFEALIMYYANNETDAKDPDVLKFKTRNEAADYVNALAKEHGQNETTIIHFNF